MDTIDLFQRLSVALAIGLLTGLERGWRSRDDAEGERAAGLRTQRWRGCSAACGAPMEANVALCWFAGGSGPGRWMLLLSALALVSGLIAVVITGGA